MTLPHEHHDGIITRLIDDEIQHIDSINVRVTNFPQSESDNADYGTLETTQFLGVTGEFVQILPQSPKRKRAMVLVRPGVQTAAMLFGVNSATAPGALGNLGSVTIVTPGTYTITATGSFGATPDTTNLNNFRLQVDGTSVNAIPVPPVAGGSATITYTAKFVAGDVIRVTNIAAGAAGSNYAGQLSATAGGSNSGTGFVVVGSRAQVANASSSRGLSGGVLYNGDTLIVESESEMWANSDGVNALSVTVLDERYR